MGKIHQRIFSEKVSLKLYVVGGEQSQCGCNVVDDAISLKSLLRSPDPSPSCQDVMADSSQLHPSLGIVLGPRKQSHPKLAPPGAGDLLMLGYKGPPTYLPLEPLRKASPAQASPRIKPGPVGSTFRARFSLCELFPPFPTGESPQQTFSMQLVSWTLFPGNPI